MTISTNYGDLLIQQAELQRLGKMPTPTLTQLRTALFAELGELAQEVKPDWAWWTKAGDRREVDPDKVLNEAADVLHFALLMELQQPCERSTGHLCPMREDRHNPRPMTVDRCIAGIARTAAEGYMHAGFIGSNLCSIVAAYGFTPEDLARAYWEKAEVNLKRWGAA